MMGHNQVKFFVIEHDGRKDERVTPDGKPLDVEDLDTRGEGAEIKENCKKLRGKYKGKTGEANMTADAEFCVRAHELCPVEAGAGGGQIIASDNSHCKKVPKMPVS